MPRVRCGCEQANDEVVAAPAIGEHKEMLPAAWVPLDARLRGVACAPMDRLPGAPRAGVLVSVCRSSDAAARCDWGDEQARRRPSLWPRARCGCEGR